MYKKLVGFPDQTWRELRTYVFDNLQAYRYENTFIVEAVKEKLAREKEALEEVKIEGVISDKAKTGFRLKSILRA